MVYSEVKWIEIKSSGGRECDFTGNWIPPMESYLRIFEEFSLKRSSVSKFKNMIREKENSDSIEIRTRHPVSHIRKCSICSQRFEDNFKIESLTEEDSRKWFCENYLEDIIEKCQDTVRHLDEAEYVYDSGFVVMCKKDRFKDIIEEELVTRDNFIKIGCLERCGYFGKTDIKNTNRLIENIRKSKGNRGPYDGGYCIYCGEEHEDGKDLTRAFDNITFGKNGKKSLITICEKCIHPMINELENFLESEKEFIVSRKI